MRMPKECQPCARNTGAKCLAFKGPTVMWKNGAKCWGFTEDVDQVARELEDIERYAKARKGRGYHGIAAQYRRQMELKKRGRGEAGKRAG